MAPAAGEEGRRSAPVGEADVEAGVALEHAAEHERGDGQRLLVGEAEEEVEVPAAQAGVEQRPVDAGRGGVHEQRDVEGDARRVEHVAGWIVERAAGVGADVAAEQAQLRHAPAELVGGRRRVLPGEGREAEQATRVVGDERGHGVVVMPAEGDGSVGVDVVEVGERVGRQHLQLDAGFVHRGDPQLGVHEHRAAVAHAAQLVAADPEPLLAVDLGRARARARRRRRGRARAQRGHGRRSRLAPGRRQRSEKTTG